MIADLSTLDDRIHVQVIDREDVARPFSKGTLAMSLLVTGMPTHQAHAIAATVARGLQRAQIRTIRSDDLAVRTENAVDEDAGSVFAQRYEAWRMVKRRGRPLVICLSGAPGVGKSTMATRLSLRLGIERIVTTDSVREVLRTVMPNSVLPDLNASSFERTEGFPLDSHQGGFALQMRIVTGAIASVARRSVEEGRSVILEGVHLLPGAVRRQLKEDGLDAIVVERLLTLVDEDLHRAQWRRRSSGDSGDGRDYDEFARLRVLQGELRRNAWTERVTEHDIAHPEDLTQRVVDEVAAQGLLGVTA